MLNDDEKRVIEIIKEDESYYNYFFSKLNKARWFYPLKDEGFFDINKIQKDKITENLWKPLLYFENLCKNIDPQENENIINEILKIIISLTERQKEYGDIDNYRNWHQIIEIISSLPNKYLTEEILNCIEIWLRSESYTSLLEMSLPKKLLPKFLYDRPKAEDIKKAEIILKNITKPQLFWDKKNNSYILSLTTRIDLFDEIVSEVKTISTEISKFCSNNIFLHFFDYLKKLMVFKKWTEIQKRIEINNSENLLKIQYFPDKDLSNLSLTDVKGNEIFKLNFNNISNLTYTDIFNKVNTEIQEIPNQEKIYSEINKVLHTLTNDSSHVGIPFLSNANFQHAFQDWQILAIFIRNVLTKRLEHYPKETNKLLSTLLKEEYYFPIYKRFIFYCISIDWENTKDLFWKIIQDDDPDEYFSNYLFYHELYEILKNNVHKFKHKEKEILNNIIENNSSKHKIEDLPNSEKHWQFRWYCALRYDEFFKPKYEEYKKLFNHNESFFENEGKHKVIMGEKSPLSEDELLNKPNIEIRKYIDKFKPEGPITETTIGGLAMQIQNITTENPQKIVNEISLYQEVPYLYAHHILLGLREAWKNKRAFNWDKVLQYIKDYINSEKFHSKELQANEIWKADDNWVLGAAANLIEEGCRDDNWSIETKNLGKAKEIINTIIDNFEVCENEDLIFEDYVTYALNTTAGKILHAIIEYSLKKSRSEYDSTESGIERWDNDLQEKYDEFLNKNIIDAYILQGQFFRQFMYLNSFWLFDWIYKNLEKETHLRNAFFGGFLFNPPIRTNNNIFKKIVPHYKAFINTKSKTKGHTRKGLINHLMIYYIIDYIDLNSESILVNFLKTSDYNLINEFIRHISFNINTIKSLRKSGLEDKILSLWEYILNIYKEFNDKESKKVKANLLNLIQLFENIDDKLVDKMIISANSMVDEVGSGLIFKELRRIVEKNKENIRTDKIGKFLATILQNITPYPYPEEDYKFLVEYLYENGDRENANYICDQYGKRGYYFLKETWEKYNP